MKPIRVAFVFFVLVVVMFTCASKDTADAHHSTEEATTSSNSGYCKAKSSQKEKRLDDEGNCSGAPPWCTDSDKCENDDGEALCRCKKGFMCKEKQCKDNNECNNNGYKCHADAECLNNEGSYCCKCKKGFIGDGKICHEVCNPNPCCGPKTVCEPDETKRVGYRCVCPPGKTGPECQFKGPCLSSPCKNGKCIQVGDTGDYKCECDENYIGAFCQFKDPCTLKPHPCNEHGKCIPDETYGGCTCDCDKDYIGRTCQYEDKCSKKPCQHDGLCTTDTNGQAKCICSIEYTGVHCETLVNCDSNPCQNAGECTTVERTVGTSFSCSCTKGFLGEFCEIPVTCDDHPCENGGSCASLKSKKPGEIHYNCSCAAGFSGTNCEIIEFGCGQDITTPGFPESPTELDTPDGGEPFSPEKKYFCPVVQTVRERDGCKKCIADSDDNCEGCCEDKKKQCEANCDQIENFCEACKATPAQCNDQCSGNTSTDLELCRSSCSSKDKACLENCKPSGNEDGVPTKCPNVVYCATPSGQVNYKDKEVSGKQCRAYKYPSGEVVCSTKTVTGKKSKYHSYIMFPRIHFAGKVQIDSATLNNVYNNYDTKTFVSANEERTNENWNPSGSSDFRLVDIVVSRVCHEDGLCVYRSHTDPVVGASVKGQANGKVAAKIVDLDIEIQGRVSEIYGMSIDVGGFFKGDMERASFQSLWYKMIDVPNDDFGEGSRFQSVLNNVQFSAKVSDSTIAQHLQEHIGPNQKLSICFNIDMVGEHPASNYSFARIVGSIGLAGEDAPNFFDHGRLLRHLPATTDLSYAPFMVDENKKKIYLDLGNTLAINRQGDILSSVGQLSLGVYSGDSDETGVDNPTCLNTFTWIDRIYYDEYGGYVFTAGINVIDIPGHLKRELYKQFVIAKVDEDGSCQKVVLAEHKKGYSVRARSHFIYRAEYQEVVSGSLFVTIFGRKPVTKSESQKIGLKLKTADSIIRGHPLTPTQLFGIFIDSTDPGLYNYYFYANINTANARKYIDGQIYALQYTYDSYPLNPDRDEAINTGIFIHVYEKVETSETTTWLTFVRPIFHLYANLFPVMRSFVDLADYDNVVKKKCHILTAMSLDFEDPQFMPVTRDLSPKKTEMILKWLDQEKPAFGLTQETRLSKRTLLGLLQIALELEHSTIPIYLNGYLSIKPFQNEEVKKMLLQIIVDEMFHFAQVANIINGLGGRPYLLGRTFVPVFPSHLPGGCRPNMIATIDKISAQQIHDVYMEIEEPSYVLKEHELVALINKISSAQLKPLAGGTEEPDVDALKCKEALEFFPLPNKKLTEAKHETIGDLYMAVVYVLGKISICGKKDIFTNRAAQLKWADPGRLREVHSYDDALKAIKAIVDQGEGASPYNPLQQNVDSSELAHYFKFSSIFHGNQIATFNVTADKVYNNNKEACHENYVYAGDKIPFFETGVWPVVRNPRMSKYKPDSLAYKNAQAFNEMYRKLLETLQSVFDGNVERFDDTFGLMKSLIVYGNRVVQTPIDENGDPDVGPNAGPTYFH